MGVGCGQRAVLVVGVLVMAADALRGSRDMRGDSSDDDVFFQVAEFGFEPEGRFQLTIQPHEGSSLELALLSREQKDYVEYNSGLVNDAAVLCEFPFSMRVEVSNTTRDVAGAVVVSDLYTLFVLNCHRSTFRTDIAFHFTNPTYGEVSVVDAPLPVAYSVLLALYCVLCIAWAGAVCFRNVGLNGMQWLAVGACGWFVLQMSVLRAFYHHYQSSGESRADLLLWHDILRAVASSLTLAALLWFSTGDRLVHRDATHLHFQLGLGVVVVFAVLSIAGASCWSGLACTAFPLAATIVKFFITFCVIVGLNVNIERLRSAIAVDGVFVGFWRPTLPQMHVSLKMFYDMRVVVVLAYYALPIVLLFLETTVLSWKQAWLLLLWHHTLSFLLVLALSVFVYPGSPLVLDLATYTRPGHHQRDEQEQGVELMGMAREPSLQAQQDGERRGELDGERRGELDDEDDLEAEL